MLTNKKYVALLTGLLSVVCSLVNGQNIRPFTSVFSQNFKGGTAIFGNTSMQIIDNSTANLLKMNETGNASNGIGGLGFSQYGNDEENMQAVMTDFQQPILNVIKAGENWLYNTTGADLGAGWRTITTPSNSWLNTGASFGYGRNQHSTITHSVTSYFVKNITLPNPALYSKMDFAISYDDAAVIYVNGMEVNRLNIAPTATVNFNTIALTSNFSIWDNFSIPSSYFHEGQNAIAVEIHQISASSNTCFFDLQLSATPAYTSNSSTANLVLPAGINTIKYARLYWGGKIQTSILNANPDTIKKIKIRKGETGVYTELLSIYNPDIYTVNGSTKAYQSYVDVKDFIKNNGAGTYSIANIPMIEGSASYGGNYAGWCIIIAFQNNALPLNSVRIFDGFSQVYNNGNSASQNITLTGLNIPTTPLSAGDAVLSTLAWEGDANIASSSTNAPGDYLKINGVTVSNTANPANNFFNGSISSKGQFIHNKNADFTNQMGIDIDEVEVGMGYGILPNATEMQIEFGTEADKYFPGVLAVTVKMSTPINAPVINNQVINFSAAISGDKGELKWKTENELNSNYFEIERAEDGINFTKRGIVIANGTTTITHYYEYSDALNTHVAVVYYRLKIVDTNGHFSYSEIIPLAIKRVINNQVAVYPTIFTDNFKISFNSIGEGNALYRLISFDGKEIIKRKVFVQQGQNILEVNNFGQLATGNYILEFINGKERFTKKILKK